MALNQTQRPQFYENQYLGAEDLEALVEYARVQQARHALGAHTWGIAMGLELKEKPSSAGGDQVDMYIQPGFAWDGFGRAIAVFEPYKIPPERFKTLLYDAAIDGGTPPGRLVDVWIGYDESATQGPRPGFELCGQTDQFARIQESFQIQIGILASSSSHADQHDPIIVAGRPVDAAQVLKLFDTNDPLIRDESIPYQTFPQDDSHALWLIPLGFVRWKPNPDPSQPGNFVKRSHTGANDDLTQSRRLRRYIGVVAEYIQAADKIIRLRDRTTDYSTAAWSDDLVWVEGNLRVNGDARLFGGKLDLRDQVGENNGIPLAIQRGSIVVQGSAGGSQSVTELRAVIGQSHDGNNCFAVGPLERTTSTPPTDVFREKLIVRDDGKVGIGTLTPRNPLAIRGTGPAEELLSFEDANGTTKWHINQKLDGSGLNFAETGIANGRLFIQAGGNVGIGTLTPRNPLAIRGTGSAEELLSFEDANGTTKWHINQKLDGSGLNFAETGIANGRLFIQAGGNVGIGTTKPGAPLHVADYMAVGPFAATTGQGGIDVTGPIAELGFVKRTLTAWPANRVPGDRFVWYNPDGTARLWTEVIGDLLTVTSVGRVGIGTVAPQEALDVRGNVKLHIDGSLYAPGSIENLRVIRGTVNSDGTVAAGTGFTVAKEAGLGLYSITFTPFPSTPSGSVAQIFPATGGTTGGDTRDNALFIEIDNQKARVKTGDSEGDARDRSFTFVIMGPR